MYAARDPNCVYCAIGIAAMIVDQFKHARAKSLPWFGGRRCSAELNDEERNTEVLLNG